VADAKDEALAGAKADGGIQMPSRRQLIVGGALMATAATAWWRTPRTLDQALDPEKMEDVIPKRIGPWSFETRSGLVLPPPDQLSASIYDTILTRSYSSSTELPMMLLIAYGASQSGMFQIHRPEFCYPASGYALTSPEAVDIGFPGGPVVPSRYFSAASAERTEQLIYWTRIARAYPASWLDQRLTVMRSNLAGRIPDGVLVRISTISTDGPRAIAAMTEFARALVATTDARGRALLINGARA